MPEGVDFSTTCIKSLTSWRLRGILMQRDKFCCPFRVGIEVLLAARLGQHPQVGRVALLSASVNAY